MAIKERKKTRLLKKRKGQGMVEYGLILGLVALVVVLALSFMPEPINQVLNGITETLGIGP